MTKFYRGTTKLGITPQTWRKMKDFVFERDGWRCGYCRRKLNKNTATADHVIPRSKGGTNNIANLITSCESCNKGKGNSMTKAAVREGLTGAPV